MLGISNRDQSTTHRARRTVSSRQLSIRLSKSRERMNRWGRGAYPHGLIVRICVLKSSFDFVFSESFIAAIANRCQWFDRIQSTVNYLISIRVRNSNGRRWMSEDNYARRRIRGAGEEESRTTARIWSCGAISRFRRPCGELSTRLRRATISRML